MTSATLEGDGGRLRLAGVLDHASVVALREQGSRLIQAAPGALELDCAGVRQANSAGLALLLALVRDAQAAGKPLTITALPATLRQIAEVSDALVLLPLAAEATR